MTNHDYATAAMMIDQVKKKQNQVFLTAVVNVSDLLI